MVYRTEGLLEISHGEHDWAFSDAFEASRNLRILPMVIGEFE
jgi:hypothetical protein